jgi:hypothetical protein
MRIRRLAATGAVGGLLMAGGIGLSAGTAHAANCESLYTTARAYYQLWDEDLYSASLARGQEPAYSYYTMLAAQDAANYHNFIDRYNLCQIRTP